MKKMITSLLICMFMLLSVAAMAQDKSDNTVKPKDKVPSESTTKDLKTDKKSKDFDKSGKESGTMLQEEENKDK
jgi:Ni/Co efflux regulator RcnB